MSPHARRMKNIRCAISQVKRNRIYKLDKYQCVYCGVQLPRDPDPFRTVDHLIPIRDLLGLPKSEINRMSNLVSACRVCNMSLASVQYTDKILRFGRFAMAECKS